MTHLRQPAAFALAAVTLAAALAACGGTQKPSPPPEPFRPEPVAEPETVAPTRTDCDPPDPSRNLDAMTYAEREPSISEATQLAREGVADLEIARTTDDQQIREEKLTQAVDTLLSALAADPYNVHATYNLAAAYARIDRRQCSLNLLSRLIQMKSHSSRKAEVQQKFDRLLGSNGAPLDPDFRQMRDDDRFRCIISNIGAPAPTDCFAAR